MIYWKKEYELGLVDVDKQHKYLIDVAVEAYELLKNKLAVDKYDKIVRILQELRDYTIFHFEYEENFMKKISLTDSKLKLNKEKITTLKKQQLQNFVGGSADESLEDAEAIRTSKKYPELCPPPKSDRLCGGPCGAPSGW